MRRAVLFLCLAAASHAAPANPRNAAPQVRYLGSKVCAGCHRAIYEKFVRTPMGRSITRPEAGPWPEPASVQSPEQGREYRVFKDNGALYHSESAQQGGARLFETVHKLEYAIGSGENGVSFAVRRGNYLFQAPLSYYSKARKWGLSPGFEQSDEGFSRPIYDACIVCHAGRAQPEPRRDGLYRDPPFAEMSIGCENCHGPGQLHVEERGKGAARSLDTSIVNPARLTTRLAEDICLECHQGGDARVLLPGKEYSDFRPGTPLVRTVAIVGLPAAGKRADLLEHHSSMKLSKCYRATNGKLGCLSCHDPHERPDSSEAAAYFRSRCLGCHTSQSCTLKPKTRQSTSPADNCVECHMPKRSVDRISHSALTDHRIRATPDDAYVPPQPQAPSVLPGLELLDDQPGEPELPLVTRLAAYGELMDRAPELRPKYFELLEQAGQSAAGDPLVLAALGRKALAERKPEAVTLLAKSELKGTPGAATYIDLSEALAKAGNGVQAVAALERGEAAYPYSKAIRKHLVLGYIRQNAYAKAKAAMERYVEDFPEDSFMRRLLDQVRAAPQN